MTDATKRLTPAMKKTLAEVRKDIADYERGWPIDKTHAFQRAAAEARKESRRYWAKGGPADLQYPIRSSKRSGGASDE